MDWFRFYSEAIRDAKIRRLARLMQASVAEAVGVWAIVLSIASESPERGVLLIGKGVPAEEEDLSQMAGITGVRRWLDHMKALGMLTFRQEDQAWVVTHWGERQFASDDTTGRVNRWRQQKRQEQGETQRYSKVTCNVTVTFPETESETDNDKGAGAPAPPKRPPEHTQRLTIATQEYFRQFNRRRWATAEQRDAFLACEREVGSDVMIQAVKWAARKGIPDIDSICTAARHWGNRPKRPVTVNGREAASKNDEIEEAIRISRERARARKAGT